MQNQAQNFNQDSDLDQEQNKNQEQPFKKEPFFLMTIKTPLIVLIFIALGAVIGLMGYVLTKKQVKVEAPEVKVSDEIIKTDSSDLPSKDSATDDWQIYRSEKGGFELKALVKWDFYEHISSVTGGVDLFLFFDKDATTTSIDEYDYVQLNIRIKQNKQNLSMEDFYNGKQSTELFRNAQGGYNEVIIGGKNAVRFKEKDDIGADVVVIPLHGKFIEIDSANSNIEMFNQILSTFKFIED
ncbi:hypothetical protein KAR28_02460 [Candidatus Parcubacteria bacterium]|nr:hypothetical protein [Candidatus Parcubacteria bacterium]